MSTRRLWLASFLLSASCANPNQKMEVLPMTLGAWKRLAVENIPAEEYPENLKRLGVKRARRAIYTGATRITASIYEFAVPAVAFELVQKWRPQPKKMALHQGPYFIMLESEQDDHASMNTFAAALEGGLK